MRRRTRHQTFEGDAATAPPALSVLPVAKEPQGALEVRQLGAGMAQQGGDLRSLESQRRPLRIVFVIGWGLGPLDDAVEVAGETLDLSGGLRPLRCNQIGQRGPFSRREPVAGHLRTLPVVHHGIDGFPMAELTLEHWPTGR